MSEKLVKEIIRPTMKEVTSGLKNAFKKDGGVLTGLLIVVVGNAIALGVAVKNMSSADTEGNVIEDDDDFDEMDELEDE